MFRWSFRIPALVLVPSFAFAQASPFSGTTNLSTNAVAILAPFAALAVMALAFLAWFDRIRWSTAMNVMIGIVLFFGATQMVDWVRGMFGV